MHSAVRLVLLLTGALDVAAMREALATLVERHEILGARLSPATELPIPGPSNQGEFALPLLDLSAEPRDISSVDDIIVTILAEESLTGFELGVAPLLRCWLVRVSPLEHALSLVVHRGIAEQSGAESLFGELPTLYRLVRDCRQGAPTTHRTVDAGGQQPDRITPEDRLADRQGRFADAGPSKLAGQKPPTGQAGPGMNLEFVLPANTWRRLRTTASQIGASVPALVLSAFAALLGHRADQDDFVVSVPVPPRYRPMPIRIDLSGDPPFAGIVRQVQAELADAAIGIDVDADGPAGAADVATQSSGRSALRTMFDSISEQEARYGAGQWDGGLRATVAYADITPASLDLALVLTVGQDRLKIRLRYQAKLFSEGTMFGIAGQLTAILDAVGDNASWSLSELRAITISRHRELVDRRKAMGVGGESSRPARAGGGFKA